MNPVRIEFVGRAYDVVSYSAEVDLGGGPDMAEITWAFDEIVEKLWYLHDEPPLRTAKPTVRVHSGNRLLAIAVADYRTAPEEDL